MIRYFFAMRYDMINIFNFFLKYVIILRMKNILTKFFSKKVLFRLFFDSLFIFFNLISYAFSFIISAVKHLFNFLNFLFITLYFSFFIEIFRFFFIFFVYLSHLILIFFFFMLFFFIHVCALFFNYISYIPVFFLYYFFSTKIEKKGIIFSIFGYFLKISREYRNLTNILIYNKGSKKNYPFFDFLNIVLKGMLEVFEFFLIIMFIFLPFFYLISNFDILNDYNSSFFSNFWNLFFLFFDVHFCLTLIFICFLFILINNSLFFFKFLYFSREDFFFFDYNILKNNLLNKKNKLNLKKKMFFFSFFFFFFSNNYFLSVTSQDWKNKLILNYLNIQHVFEHNLLINFLFFNQFYFMISANLYYLRNLNYLNSLNNTNLHDVFKYPLWFISSILWKVGFLAHCHNYKEIPLYSSGKLKTFQNLVYLVN